MYCPVGVDIRTEEEKRHARAMGNARYAMSVAAATHLQYAMVQAREILNGEKRRGYNTSNDDYRGDVIRGYCL